MGVFARRDIVEGAFWSSCVSALFLASNTVVKAKTKIDSIIANSCTSCPAMIKPKSAYSLESAAIDATDLTKIISIVSSINIVLIFEGDRAAFIN